MNMQQKIGICLQINNQTYNKFIMTSKIKAAIRIRPFLKTQIKNGYVNSNIKISQSRKEVEVYEGNNHKSFNFDYVFDQSVTQEQLYQQSNIDHLIQKCLKGYHSTIFAYGQTGSGKTYSMQGLEQQQQSSHSGLIPRIFERLFQLIGSHKERKFLISLSFLQIYNQRIYDLLNPAGLAERGGAGLRLRWNKDQQFSVQNLYIFECHNKEELKTYFSAGLKNRISASHKLNVQSSRSHSILTIRIQSYEKLGSQNILCSKLQLVDLAGSQRIGLTGTEGKQAKQSIDINKSLFTLRQVISILADSPRNKAKNDKNYVPYRDSKLTSILKQSIGGNSYCLMIACICPNDPFIDENLSTLAYATKASYITNQPTINDDPRNKMISQLRRQIKGLNQELGKANQHIQLLSSMQHPKQQDLYSQQFIPLSNSSIKRGFSEKGPSLAQQKDQFSQRLVQSINMVRQLLKSNKQLRQKLENSNQRNDEKDLEIYELAKQTQFLKQKLQGTNEEYPNTHSQTAIRTSTALSRKRHISNNHRAQVHHHATQQLNYTPPSTAGNGNVLGFTAGGSKNNFNYWNSVQINQYYMNERGVDSVPTNFSRKEVVTSQQRRLSGSRNASVNERTGGRSALTAKLSSRNWKNMGQTPTKLLSFYQQSDIY